MKATRGDFTRIVSIIRRLEKGTTKRLMWAHAFAEVFKKSNTAFDEKRFVSACGADDELVEQVKNKT